MSPKNPEWEEDIQRKDERTYSTFKGGLPIVKSRKNLNNKTKIRETK